MAGRGPARRGGGAGLTRPPPRGGAKEIDQVMYSLDVGVAAEEFAVKVPRPGAGYFTVGCPAAAPKRSIR